MEAAGRCQGQEKQQVKSWHSLAGSGKSWHCSAVSDRSDWLVVGHVSMDSEKCFQFLSSPQVSGSDNELRSHTLHCWLADYLYWLTLKPCYLGLIDLNYVSFGVNGYLNYSINFFCYTYTLKKIWARNGLLNYKVVSEFHQDHRKVHWWGSFLGLFPIEIPIIT